MGPIAAIPFLLALAITRGSGQVSGAWQFQWSDEFNGTAVDSSMWGYEIGYIRNQELQYYTNRTENSRSENGTLLIQALQDNWNGHPYTSASRTTRNKRSFLYGRLEMRAKIDARAGSWPAWWWLPDSGGWPLGGEIDMMEFYQGKCLFNVMDGTGQWTSVTRTIDSLGGAAWTAAYHVWTMEWDSTRIDLSLDGVLMNHYPLANADGTGPNGSNPFRRPGYLIVNQAIGGTSGGDPSNTVFPVNYSIDWIRLHTWSQAIGYTLTVNHGTGSGPYVPATTASITADMPPPGEVFDRWMIQAGNPTIDSSASPSALLTMPAENVTVTPTYKAASSISFRSGGTMADSPRPFSRIDFFDVNGRRLFFNQRSADHMELFAR